MPSRVRRFLFGPPKDVKDPEAFHKLSLVALLAWVGLGADGLSSSAYGPDEAYRTLGENTGLAFFLALYSAITRVALPQDIAVTGEVSLAGNVRAVGGIVEQLYAARAAEMRAFVLPA